MKSKHLLGVISIFTGFGLTGCDVLNGERYPMSPGNYEVPQTQQLQRGGIIFLTRPTTKHGRANETKFLSTGKSKKNFCQ